MSSTEILEACTRAQEENLPFHTNLSMLRSRAAKMAQYRIERLGERVNIVLTTDLLWLLILKKKIWF